MIGLSLVGERRVGTLDAQRDARRRLTWTTTRVARTPRCEASSAWSAAAQLSKLPSDSPGARSGGLVTSLNGTFQALQLSTFAARRRR